MKMEKTLQLALGLCRAMWVSGCPHVAAGPGLGTGSGAAVLCSAALSSQQCQADQ